MKYPLTDLAPITRLLRAKASSCILVAAVHHLGVFELLCKNPLSLIQLQEKLQLKSRPVMVLIPALCAMDLLRYNHHHELEITALGEFLTESNSNNIIGYLGLDKNDLGVLQMTGWVKNDGPSNSAQGLSYIKDDQAVSPMDNPEEARFFTMALAGRAKHLSPVVAAEMPKRSSGHLLDIAGGSGYYTFEWLMVNPGATATIIDRPEVLTVAREILEKSSEYGASNIKDRVVFLPGDMLNDDLPKADIVLAASLFHDWPEDTCELLAHKFAQALNSGGELWVHDSFLEDTLDGPLAATDYSAMLFLATRGRCYSRKEYFSWFTKAGLVASAVTIPTLMDYGLISAYKKE